MNTNFDTYENNSDLHAERAILGCMLAEPESMTQASDLEIADFYLDSHRKIATVIRTLEAQGTCIDIVTVSERLRQRNEMDSVGDIGYLAELTEGLPRKLNIATYVRIVKEKAALRSIVTLCDAVSARAQLGDDASEEILHDLQSLALEYQSAGVKIKASPISQLVLPAYQAMQHQRDFKGEVLGIPTGIEELDRSTTGWRDGELTYVGALPGRGKTSFLLQAMYAAAVKGFPVGCISMEMRSAQLLRRLSIIHSGLHAQKFRDIRWMNEVEYKIAKDSLFALGDLPVSMCDQSGLKPSQISSLARQMHANGARAIFIDFIQIIHEDGKDRREAINRVSAALRDTCKALNIPFVVASQLARRDADPNRRPTIQDLRESGNLEQDAHNVLLLFRPKDKSTGDWTGEDEVIIDKQREGVTGVVPVHYDERTLTYIGRK